VDLSRNRIRIEQDLSGRAVKQVATQEVGAFAQRFEFASAVELVVSSRAGVVVEEVARQGVIDQHRQFTRGGCDRFGLAGAGT
jgi:hypothetical protein